MPAAAVIPAPIAYTNVAAVKTLVVDSEMEVAVRPSAAGAVAPPGVTIQPHCGTNLLRSTFTLHTRNHWGCGNLLDWW